jgi:nitrite reductase (NO-forming)
LIFIIIIGVVGAYYPAATSASSTAFESAAQSSLCAGSDELAQASQTQTTERTASNRPTPASVASQAPSDQRSAAPRPAIAPVSHNRTVAEKPVAGVPNAAPAAQSTGQATNQSASAPALSADADAGRLVYRKCQACHSLTLGKNGVGPSLADIIGKKAGEVPGFNYSPAMKTSGLTWDAATLNSYLADPQRKIPGNKMPFPGLKTENERSSLIAYLAAASSSAAPTVAQQTPAAAPSPAQPQQPATPSNQAGMSYVPGIRYTLRSGIAEGRMVFIGVGGNIDG